MKKIGSKKLKTGSGWFGKNTEELKEELNDLIVTTNTRLNRLKLNDNDYNFYRGHISHINNMIVSANNNQLNDLINRLKNINSLLDTLQNRTTSSPLTSGGRSKKKMSSKKK